MWEGCCCCFFDEVCVVVCGWVCGFVVKGGRVVYCVVVRRIVRIVIVVY